MMHGSGLKLLGHRYYDPSTGRFLTRDPAKDGRNWYAYCANEPTVAVDPRGRCLALILAIGALAIAIAGLIKIAVEGTPAIQEGRRRAHERDDDFGRGDDDGYADDMKQIPLQLNTPIRMWKDAWNDQYVWGPPTEAAAGAADAVHEGAGDAIKIASAGAQELFGDRD